MLHQVSQHMASLGVHKNGTWVVQKMISHASRVPAEASLIIASIAPFTPSLLLDPFGNYVVQQCLALGYPRNQFIFDAMRTKCLDISMGRFGARGMRACLEHPVSTQKQRKHVAIAIVGAAPQLIVNPHGSLLLTWLLENSGLPGRYRVLAPVLAPMTPTLCYHKLASSTILRLGKT